MNTPPNEIRSFVHKRLFSAAKGFVTSGFNPLAAASGFLSPTVARRQQRRTARAAQVVPQVVPRAISRTITARPSEASAAQKRLGLELKFASEGMSTAALAGSGCTCKGFRWVQAGGGCLNVLSGDTRPCDNGGGDGGGISQPIGDTVMGRYGAGEVPGSMMIDRAICRRGMVLGNDGVCYNRSQISNKEREWPRGRRPLLTGGDMRAISTAARAGRRLEGATKRLQKIGLMKKPASRRISQAQAHHALKP